MDFVLAGRMLGAFAVIALVLFGLQILVRANVHQRLTSARGNGRLVTVLETTMLQNAAALHVVKVGEKYVLIGRSNGHIATLSEIPKDTVDAWLQSQPASRFGPVSIGDFLARMRGSGGSTGD